MADSEAWKKIFEKYNLYKHDFDNEPFEITAEMIKNATKDFK